MAMAVGPPRPGRRRVSPRRWGEPLPQLRALVRQQRRHRRPPPRFEHLNDLTPHLRRHMVIDPRHPSHLRDTVLGQPRRVTVPTLMEGQPRHDRRQHWPAPVPSQTGRQYRLRNSTGSNAGPVDAR